MNMLHQYELQFLERDHVIPRARACDGVSDTLYIYDLTYISSESVHSGGNFCKDCCREERTFSPRGTGL